MTGGELAPGLGRPLPKKFGQAGEDAQPFRRQHPLGSPADTVRLPFSDEPARVELGGSSSRWGHLSYLGSELTALFCNLILDHSVMTLLGGFHDERFPAWHCP